MGCTRVGVAWLGTWQVLAVRLVSLLRAPGRASGAVARARGMVAAPARPPTHPPSLPTRSPRGPQVFIPAAQPFLVRLLDNPSLLVQPPAAALPHLQSPPRGQQQLPLGTPPPPWPAASLQTPVPPLPAGWQSPARPLLGLAARPGSQLLSPGVWRITKSTTTPLASPVSVGACLCVHDGQGSVPARMQPRLQMALTHATPTSPNARSTPAHRSAPEHCSAAAVVWRCARWRSSSAHTGSGAGAAALTGSTAGASSSGAAAAARAAAGVGCRCPGDVCWR